MNQVNEFELFLSNLENYGIPTEIVEGFRTSGEGEYKKYCELNSIPSGGKLDQDSLSDAQLVFNLLNGGVEISVVNPDGSEDVLTLKDFYEIALYKNYEYEDEEEEYEEDEDMLDMWVEKMNRPGRLAERGGVEFTKEDWFRMIKEDRDNVMDQINAMNPYEFQTRVLNGTLPEFVREKANGLLRDTCHSRAVRTEEEFIRGMTNYGSVHRDKLRYMSVEDFKELCYDLP